MAQFSKNYDLTCKGVAIMQITRKEKIIEAVKRMKTMHIIDDAIAQFIKDGTVMVSESPIGALYWIDDEQKGIVQKFEQQYNALVYLVVRSYTEFGKMDSFLYVSDYEDEWEWDNEDIADPRACAPMTYTYNYDAPELSELGAIGVQERSGGLVRIS